MPIQVNEDAQMCSTPLTCPNQSICEQTEILCSFKDSLRSTLLYVIQRRYLDNVPAIVPLLEREHRVADQRLTASKKELDQLQTDKLKVGLMVVGC